MGCILHTFHVYINLPLRAPSVFVFNLTILFYLCILKSRILYYANQKKRMWIVYSSLIWVVYELSRLQSCSYESCVNKP